MNDWLSVGAGFSFSIGRLLFQSKVNNTIVLVCLDRTEASGFSRGYQAFGGNVGILLDADQKLRVGLTYQSPIDYKFGFRSHLTNLGPLFCVFARG